MTDLAVRALAEAWASIDGKLDDFRREVDLPIADQEKGHGIGYVVEAKEMVNRLFTRGFVVVSIQDANRHRAAEAQAAALKRYLKHDEDCNVVFGNGVCTCGLSAALEPRK